MRIARALALAGVASRRKCEAHITAGEVAVNGEVVRDLGRQVEPAKDRVTFRGKILSLQPEHVYFLLHKPAGYTTTVSDPHAEKTVYELLPPELRPPAAGDAGGRTRRRARRPEAEDGRRECLQAAGPAAGARIFPVGRLDRESTGLLLFTNDGELANRLTHPRYEVSKWYQVKLDRPPDPKIRTQLLKGIPLEGELAWAERVEMIGPQEVQLELKEGKKREIRRMFQALSYRVTFLCRVAQGPLKLGNLPPGKGRLLAPSEVEMLKRACYP